MQYKISKQDQNFDKNTEIKHSEGLNLFVMSNCGYLQTFSMIENKIVHDYGQILDHRNRITSMDKTLDNKS